MRYILLRLTFWMIRKLRVEINPVRVEYNPVMKGNKCIGYIIAMRSNYGDGFGQWQIQWNNKIYSKNQVQQTLETFSNGGSWEHRIIPVYIDSEDELT